MTRRSATKAACVALFAVVAMGALAGPAAAKIGISDFENPVLGADATPSLVAGAHPASMSTAISFAVDPESFFGKPLESVKNVEVDLPVGLVGNPLATPRCTDAEFEFGNVVQGITGCDVDSQIGTATFTANPLGEQTVPLYNMVPPEGVAAEFAFNVVGTVTRLQAGVRTGDGYGIRVVAPNIMQTLPVTATDVTVWGVPADPSHDVDRGRCIEPSLPASEACPTEAVPTAFLSNPTRCDGQPELTAMRADSWQSPGQYATSTYEANDGGTPPSPVRLEECESVPFRPSFSVRPSSSVAGGPTGATVSLALPQEGLGNPTGRTTGALERAEVTLPDGMTVNSSVADGLSGCGPTEIGLDSPDPAACPGSSRIGSVTVATPLLDHEMRGAVYLATQGTNPFNSLLALYLAIEDPQSGVVLKLPGKVAPDPGTGQLTATFDDNPQLPFSSLQMHLKGGDRSPLVNPPTCGTYTTHAELTSWARPDEAVSSDSSFTIDQGCGKSSRFAPGFQAGTTNPIAGASSPFTLRVTRADGEQNLARIEATLPEGVLAKLAGVPLCGEAQAATGDCPASAQIGTTTVGAGAGSNPLYVPQPGKAPTAVYLAAPYNGAPYSLLVKVPAQAGPFDLGTVVVRNAISVDPVSAQVSVKSDPLPQILQGIPIAYRDLRVNVDRQGFTLNPTSCDPMQVKGTIASSAGKSAAVSDRFQVTNCAALPFKPSLKLKVSGPTRRGTYPKLRAELKAPPGQANIGKVSVALPHSEFLAQEHIKTICTRVQYSAGGGGGKSCPAGSVYGWARAFTPLLDKPLEGPVYLRSSSNPLPDLVASLDGQIHIDLAGRIDSVNGGIRNSFEAVPDAPVSRFVLTMQGGKKSLLVNSRNLCATKNRATVKMDGQNGKVHDFRPLVGNSCGRAKKG